MISLFTHGSPNKIDEFKLFNGRIRRDKKMVVALDEDVVFSNNSNDIYGSGIYAYYGVNTEQASLHASHEENPGYVYVLKVEHNGFIDDLESDYIDTESWLEIINNVISRVYEINGYDEERISSAIYNFASEWEENGAAPSEGEAFDELNTVLPDFLDDVSPDEYDDPDYWKYTAEEHVNNFIDPCNLVYEEFATCKSREHFVLETMRRSNNMWQMIRNMSETIAVIGTDGNVDFYSKVFHEEVCKYEQNPGDLSVARAHPDENFGVIFNTDAIEIRNVIDLSKVKEKDSSRESSLGM
ncbi:hypothetical protein FPV63_04590 [Vibrio cholerae]|nr:hypothetical protein FPV63_04590 [Vibrio cholerae]